MKKYTILASIIQNRSYTVRAESVEEAEDLVRDDHEHMPYDVIDEELDTLEVEE